jgi:hypothetical protein
MALSVQKRGVACRTLYFFGLQKNKILSVVHTRPENGRGQMTQTDCWVNTTRKERDGKPRVKWMKGSCDGLSKSIRKKKGHWMDREEQHVGTERGQ